MDGITKFKNDELNRKVRAYLNREDVNERITLAGYFLFGLVSGFSLIWLWGF